jgi:hypothetical protein
MLLAPLLTWAPAGARLPGAAAWAALTRSPGALANRAPAAVSVEVTAAREGLRAMLCGDKDPDAVSRPMRRSTYEQMVA